MDKLYIYSSQGRYISTINLHEKINDATWTSYGNILYSASGGVDKIAMISKAGSLITQSKVNSPELFSTSQNFTIYVGSRSKNVFASNNDGFDWNNVNSLSQLPSNISTKQLPYRNQVVATTMYDKVYFWIHCVMYCEDSATLQLYSKHGNKIGHATRKNFNVTLAKETRGTFYRRLTSDGGMNVFLSDPYNKAVHAFSADGQHHSYLLSASDFYGMQPSSLTLDRKKSILYVGQSQGSVRAFNLLYTNIEFPDRHYYRR